MATVAPLPTVPRVKLGPEGMEVSVLGLGCLGMTGFYGLLKPEAEMIELIRYAVVDCGVTFLDNADRYGPFTNETLIGKAIKGIRGKVQIATKFGGIHTGEGTTAIRGDPEWVRTACEASLKRLDVDYIDLYYQVRIDTKVPIEITVGAMKKLVEEGKVKHLGLCEASASEIRRACTCSAPYNFCANGMVLVDQRFGRRYRSYVQVILPKFLAGNMEKNDVLRARVTAIAEKKNCSPNQLALAWVLHKGKDVVPIPGTTKKANLESNIGSIAVSLTKEEIAEIEAAVPADEVAGERLSENLMKLTWRQVVSPPLSSWKDSKLH